LNQNSYLLLFLGGLASAPFSGILSGSWAVL